jgi:hypothetical protein
MQRSVPIISTKVALIGGFLLLGLLAVAAWLLLSASPASAQTDDASPAPESSSTDPATAQEPTPPALPSSTALPAIDLNLNVPDIPPPTVDLTPLTQTLRPVTEALPSALQPAVTDLVELLPPPVRAPVARVATVLSGPAPSSSRSDPAPSANTVADESVPPGPSADAVTTGGRAIGGVATHSRSAGELSAADASSDEGGTRAPPSGLPSPVAAQGNVVSSSAGHDFGQMLLLLFGVLAAGIIVLLGRGRRLLTEALGWLPAPWCALIERPG